jgi:hypothetical protein
MIVPTATLNQSPWKLMVDAFGIALFVGQTVRWPMSSGVTTVTVNANDPTPEGTPQSVAAPP